MKSIGAEEKKDCLGTKCFESALILFLLLVIGFLTNLIVLCVFVPIILLIPVGLYIYSITIGIVCLASKNSGRSQKKKSIVGICITLSIIPIIACMGFFGLLKIGLM